MRNQQPPAERDAPPAARDAVRARLAACALAWMAVIGAVGLALGAPIRAQGTAMAAFGLASVLAGVRIGRRYPHSRLGGCNAVTLLRAALVAALLMPLTDGRAAGYGVATLAAVALALDGVDGWLARRSGLVSRFGARFDMEVDAALALVLALHVLTGTAVGSEVLVLGLIRYVFVLAAWAWPWLGGDLAESRRRKLVCVLQLSALIALQIPALPPDAAILLTRGAAMALIWSFAIDIIALRKGALAKGVLR